jgi:GNAT superfamily N-acetyltransferase
MNEIRIRRAVAAEADDVAAQLRRVREQNLATIPPPVHSLDDMRGWMRDVVFTSMAVWVAEVRGGQPEAAKPPTASGRRAGQSFTGVMVLKPPDELDQLYVDARFTGRGLGSRFVELAKREFPRGLRLWTFQSNVGARRFYERHGFVPVEWTDGDNEEGAPDVRYEWRPAPQRSCQAEKRVAAHHGLSVGALCDADTT